MKTRTKQFLKEHAAIIMAVLSFFIFQFAIRLVDPTAATYDAGVLQIAVTTIVYFVVFQWVVWRVINGLWPALADYAKRFFNEHFKLLTPWQQIKVFLLVYFVLFTELVALSRVIS